MLKTKEVTPILEELKERTGVEGVVKVKFKPFKKKIASVSLTNRVIYLNSRVVSKLTRKELEFLIAHELLHLKHGLFHSEEFEKELKNLFESKEELEIGILRKFLEN
ncbi:MAG: M48 family peptidase [Desulfurobacterium sp.]|nr:MAG: M48 family peptidase [Desulfurobacterium sp.]